MTGILAVVAGLSLASSAHAQLDAWGTAGGPGGSTIYTSQSLFGVTLGTNALQATVPQGNFWGPSTGNLLAPGTELSNNKLAEMQQATTLSFDLTLIGNQLSGTGGQFSGFAQSNELTVSLFSNPVPSLPTGINLFIQRNFASGGATDSLGLAGQWSGVDGTRTLTWNLSNFTGLDPSDGQTKTVAQLLLAHPDIQLARIEFVAQVGGGSGPANFFFDNVRLLGNGVNALIGNFEPIPEPGSLILASLAVPPVIAAIRRRRKAATE